MWSAIFITLLILLILACVLILFNIKSEEGPKAQHSKPREGGTELMPKIMNPPVPKKKDEK